MLYVLPAMTLDTDTGLLAVDGPAGVRVLDLAALVLDQVGEVDAPRGEPRLSLNGGAADGDEGALPADVETIGAGLDAPDAV